MDEYQFMARGRTVGSWFSPVIVVFMRHCVSEKRRRRDFVAYAQLFVLCRLISNATHLSPPIKAMALALNGSLNHESIARCGPT
jgi:hypothetical protein